MATLERPDAQLVTELWTDCQEAEDAMELARLRFLTTHLPGDWDRYLEADRVATEARSRAEAAHHAYYSA